MVLTQDVLLSFYSRVFVFVRWWMAPATVCRFTRRAAEGLIYQCLTVNNTKCVCVCVCAQVVEVIRS